MRYLNGVVLLAAIVVVAGCGKEKTDSPTAKNQAVKPVPTVEQPKASAEAEPAPAIPGLAIGQPAPDFELPDQHGKTHSLKELLASGPVALVFYRSADW